MTFKSDDDQGRKIAAKLDWDGARIMRTFASALEDANFHAECSIVLGWLSKFTTGDPS